MIPAPPLKVQCPHCGEVKALIDLLSGNTFGGIVWSDMKAEYPMLPQNSAVQRCPKCGKYFFLADAKTSTSKKCKYNPVTGTLNFNEAKEAYFQLYEDAATEGKFILRLYILQSFNDRYGRLSENEKPSEDDVKLFEDNCREMIGMERTDATLRSELYRELGEYEKCLSALDRLAPANEYENKARDQIREHALRKDSKVFSLK